MRRNPDDPSLPGWLLYRFFHVPRNALRLRNADFLLYLLVGRRVCAGPFAGLRYVGSSPNPHIGPALLGTYEMELNPFVERLLAQDFDVFVDIGAAEGYYAAGFARFGRAARVIAYEGDRLGRVLTRFMGRRNGVAHKLDLRGFCEPRALAETLAPFRHPALLVDIEGLEGEMLDPAVNPHLTRATMLVELHEHQVPMADLLRARFAASHVIEEVWSRPRTPGDLPGRLGLARWFFSPDRLLRFADETRGRQMRWWLLTPRTPA